MAITSSRLVQALTWSSFLLPPVLAGWMLWYEGPPPRGPNPIVQPLIVTWLVMWLPCGGVLLLGRLMSEDVRRTFLAIGLGTLQLACVSFLIWVYATWVVYERLFAWLYFYPFLGLTVLGAALVTLLLRRRANRTGTVETSPVQTVHPFVKSSHPAVPRA